MRIVISIYLMFVAYWSICVSKAENITRSIHSSRAYSLLINISKENLEVVLSENQSYSQQNSYDFRQKAHAAKFSFLFKMSIEMTEMQKPADQRQAPDK